MKSTCMELLEMYDRGLLPKQIEQCVERALQDKKLETFLIFTGLLKADQPDVNTAVMSRVVPILVFSLMPGGPKVLTPNPMNEIFNMMCLFKEMNGIPSSTIGHPEVLVNVLQTVVIVLNKCIKYEDSFDGAKLVDPGTPANDLKRISGIEGIFNALSDTLSVYKQNSGKQNNYTSDLCINISNSNNQ